MATTRRAFVGGAMAGASASLLIAGEASAGLKAPVAPPKAVRRGRALAVAGDGRTFVVAHERRSTIGIVGRHGSKVVEVGGQPLEIAIAPGDRWAAVTTAFWDEPGVAIVDLRSAKLVDRIQAGRSPFGVVFAGDGRVLAVTGGDEDGEINLFDSESLKPLRSEPIGIAPVGVVAEPGGKSVLVALAGADQVVRVGVDDGKIKQTFKVPRAPDRIAVSPDGKSLLITHAGVRADTVTQLDLHHGKTDKVHAGRLPSAVAWTRRGRRLIALGGAGQVVELRKGGGRRKHAVKGSPRALAVAGEKAWVVDGLTGKIERVG